MPTDRAHEALNDAERARLEALVSRLSDEQLAAEMPAGWTVAAVLAHVAFWDGRAVVLMQRWRDGASPSPEDAEPGDVDWINDAGKPLCLALPPRTAAELAIRLAREADAGVAALSDETLAHIRSVGEPFSLARASHRREHLDQIEARLRGP